MMLHVMFWEMSLIQYEICRSLVKQWIHQSHQTAVTSVGRGLHLLCILVHCIDLIIYVRILCSYCLSTTVVVNSLMLPLLWWQIGHSAEVNSIHILHVRWCQRVYLSHIGFRICWRKLHQCTMQVVVVPAACLWNQSYCWRCGLLPRTRVSVKLETDLASTVASHIPTMLRLAAMPCWWFNCSIVTQNRFTQTGRNLGVTPVQVWHFVMS